MEEPELPTKPGTWPAAWVGRRWVVRTPGPSESQCELVDLSDGSASPLEGFRAWDDYDKSGPEPLRGLVACGNSVLHRADLKSDWSILQLPSKKIVPLPTTSAFGQARRWKDALVLWNEKSGIVVKPDSAETIATFTRQEL